MEKKTCFVISPIGEEGSDTRRKADIVYDNIILPAAKICDINAVRSDYIENPGKISDQMHTKLHQSDLCIADLTSRNPNVYYELAIAQKACRPVVILLSKDEKLPFDVGDFRCIYYDANAKNYDSCIKKVVNFIKKFEEDNWIVEDLFAKYQLPQKISIKPVEFDDIKLLTEKTTHYKIIALSLDHDKPAIYEKYIPRLKRSVGIFSEYVATLITCFDKPVKNFTHNHRTDGDALELHGLLPFQYNLEDADFSDTNITPIISAPSNVIINQMCAYNGLKTGKLDLSTKSEKDTAIARLIVDFSSVPGFEKMIKLKPTLWYKYKDENNTVVTTELPYENIYPGIYWVIKKDLKKDEVLRFEFTANVSQ